MRHFRWLVFVFCCTALCGCVSSGTVHRTDRLDPGRNEGYLVALVHVNVPQVQVQLQPRNGPADYGFFAGGYGIGPLQFRENLICIKVPAGTYSFTLFRRGLHYRIEECPVRVEAGCMNYSGTLDLNGEVTGYEEWFLYRLHDSFADVETLFRGHYPEIAGTYPFFDRFPRDYPDSDRWKEPSSSFLDVGTRPPE
jgi:hypothetical protein